MSTLNQIAGHDATGSRHPRRKTYGVSVGHVRVGGGAPIVVQSMTNTDTADVESTLKQTLELAEAGSELVRWTVNVPEAAAAVPEIKKRLLEAGCNVPIIGDFHYNGHVLLTKNIRTAPNRSTNTASIPAMSARASAAMSSSPQSAESRATTANRYASASMAARSIKSWSC